MQHKRHQVTYNKCSVYISHNNNLEKKVTDCFPKFSEQSVFPSLFTSTLNYIFVFIGKLKKTVWRHSHK